MTKLVIVHPHISGSILQSFASDVNPITYDEQLTKEQILSASSASSVSSAFLEQME